MTNGEDAWRNMIPPPYPFPSAWAALAQRQQQRDASAMRWLSPFTPVSQYIMLPRRNATATTAATAVWIPPPAADPLDVPMEKAVYNAPSPAPLFSRGNYDLSHALRLAGEDQEEEEDEEDEEDGDYEYGYVLRDEWRRYLRETVLSDGEEDEEDVASVSVQRRPHPHHHQAQQQQQKKKTQKKKSSQPTTKRPTPTVVRPTRPLELALDDARAIEKQRHHERHALVCNRSAWQRVDHLETALHTQFEAFCDRHAPTVWPQGAS